MTLNVKRSETAKDINMKQETILKKAIEKANYKSKEVSELLNFYRSLDIADTATEASEFGYRIGLLINTIIFSHDFAKAFWGESRESRQLDVNVYLDQTAWQYHLQTMVLEEEPIKYLEKFI